MKTAPRPATLSSASYITLQLARFDAIRANGGITPGDCPELIFAGVAAATRAAGTEPASQPAFVLAAYGYGADPGRPRPG